MKMTNDKKILIATGGTGGHIFPAYSLANNLINKKFLVDIVTDSRGYKFLKNYKNLRIKIIETYPIIKKTPLNFISSLIKLFISLIKALIYLKKTKPDVVFGMGGYSSFSICLAAKILGISFIIYENNLCVGKANRYLLPFTKKMFVGYGEVTGIKEKYRFKVVKTGNIIRQEILDYIPVKNFEAENKMNVLVLGGSQAAKSFGMHLPNIFKKCKNDKIPIKIYQQCLPEQIKNLEVFYKKNQIEFELFHFTDNILKYFSIANIVITRAGASILAELINCKLPIISIPLPTSAENHQFQNANYFLKKGYGYLIEEHDVITKLFPLIKSIYKDKSLITNLIEKQKKHSDVLVFRVIENQINELINE